MAIRPVILSGLLLVITLMLPLGCGRASEQGGPDATADQARIVKLKNLGLANLEAEQHDRAAILFDELIERLPEEPMAHANRGLIELRQGRLESGTAYLDAAQRLAPDNTDVAVLRAHAARLAGDFALAAEVLQRAVSDGGGDLAARWMLAETLQMQGKGERAIPHLSAIAGAAPQNIVARLDLARQLLEQGDGAAAMAPLRQLDELGAAGDPGPREQLDTAMAKIADGDTGGARIAVIILNNLLKPAPIWQRSLAELRGPPVPVAEPIWSFIATTIDEPGGGPQPVDVTFRETGTPRLADATLAGAVVHTPGAAPRLVVARREGLVILERGDDGRYVPAATIPLEGTVVSLDAADWNNDRLIDLVCGFADGTVRRCMQDANGRWRMQDPEPRPAPGVPGGVTEAGSSLLLRPWDADHDGDLDLLVGRAGQMPALLRNNGDGTFTEAAEVLGLARSGDAPLLDAVVGDLDDDGDLDLVTVGAGGGLRWCAYQRSGGYRCRVLDLPGGPFVAVTMDDLDHDGLLDLVLVGRDGTCRIAGNSGDGRFDVHVFADARHGDGGASAAVTVDVDNDGWLDLIVLAAGRPTLLRNRGELTFEVDDAALPGPRDAVRILLSLDHDLDGDLDLLVIADGGPRILDNDGGNANNWQQVELQSILQGGQRNNAYGIGGVIEARAGRLYQKRRVTGAVTHLGLGAAAQADAIRVIWPNGVPQNIIEPAANQLVAEPQELKGSCPFLLTWDGRGFGFVTDLLWRSPLGLKINAQMVAPVLTTLDYVRIRADQLTDRDGRYDLLITAALWETMYFDEVQLLAVDHPAQVSVFVDERFVAPVFPPFEVHVVDEVRPPASATDHRGRDVLRVLRDRDGLRLGGFGKGRYQGVAEPHFIELDLGPWTGDPVVRLIAQGWILPTDTSINVALAQGRHPPPSPLRVLVADGHGGWTPAIDNAGFPAGKLKTIVLNLTGAFPSPDHRVRLATNLEIYWDRVGFALGDTDFTPRLTAQRLLTAELKFQGFPAMRRADALAPEVPDYESPTVTPTWRDLRGYYTRYGDVSELLERTDDRYVIMNAGDGLVLAFAADAPVPDGWVRDFVLFSDGWVKDGDANTVASMTVAPLPRHDTPVYAPVETDRERRTRLAHPDWRAYHTRYVTPDAFRRRMLPRQQPPAVGKRPRFGGRPATPPREIYTRPSEEDQ